MARKDSFKNSRSKNKSKDRDSSFINDKMNFEIETEDLGKLNEVVESDPVVEETIQEETIQEETIQEETKVEVKKEEPIIEETSTDDPFKDLPKKEVKESVPEQEVHKRPVSPIALLKKENEKVAKTFKLPKNLVEDFDAIFVDEDGKKIAGVKGLMSDIAANALIEYLVKLELLDKDYLKNIKELDL